MKINSNEIFSSWKEDLIRLPFSLKTIEERIGKPITEMEPYELSDGRTFVQINNLIAITSAGIECSFDGRYSKELRHDKSSYEIDLLSGPIHWINNAAEWLRENPGIDLKKAV